MSVDINEIQTRILGDHGTLLQQLCLLGETCFLSKGRRIFQEDVLWDPCEGVRNPAALVSERPCVDQ